MSKLILFQGDSITDCRRDREDDRFPGSGYSTIVSARLGLDYPAAYSCKNRGIGGNKVTDIYARMGPDIVELKPDYMSLLVGINDASCDFIFYKGERAQRFQKQYEALLEDIFSELPNLKLMLMGPFVLSCRQFYDTYVPFEHVDPTELISAVALYDEATRNVANKFSLPYVSLQPEFDKALKLAPADYWSPDGVHPTPAGHEIIAREWIRKFEEIK